MLYEVDNGDEEKPLKFLGKTYNIWGINKYNEINNQCPSW